MNTSWPLPAATSAAAAAWILSTGMWSTTTLVSCCRPHSSASTPVNHSSYSGRKCAHLAIFSVCWLASVRSGKTTNGPTAAVAAASLTTSRREGFVARTLGILTTWTTVAVGLKPDRNRPQPSEPGGVGHAGSIGLRKVPLRLEAIEVRIESRIERRAVRLLHLIQESVRGDRPGARIEDGGADEPDCSSVGAVHGLLPFGAAPVAFEVDVQLIGRLDDRRSVQAQSMLGRQVRKYFPAFRAGIGGIHRVPEVGDDPHAQEVVAEISERAVAGLMILAKGIIVVAAVDSVAIGGKSPILPELGCSDAGHRKTRRFAGTHGPARREREGPVGQPLFRRGVGLEVAHDVYHLDVAFVGDAGEEILVRQEGNDGDELIRRARAIIDIAAGGGQDADVLAGGIVGAASRVAHPVGLAAARGRTKLAENPEALTRRRVQLSDVDAVRGIKGIVEIARRMVEVLALRYCGGAGGRGLGEGAGADHKQQCQRRKEENGVLSFGLHGLVLLYPQTSAATPPRCRMTNSQPTGLRAVAPDLCRAEAPTRRIRR